MTALAPFALISTSIRFFGMKLAESASQIVIVARFASLADMRNYGQKLSFIFLLITVSNAKHCIELTVSTEHICVLWAEQ